jgi:hypothetical protein
LERGVERKLANTCRANRIQFRKHVGNKQNGQKPELEKYSKFKSTGRGKDRMKNRDKK